MPVRPVYLGSKAARCWHVQHVRKNSLSILGIIRILHGIIKNYLQLLRTTFNFCMILVMIFGRILVGVYRGGPASAGGPQPGPGLACAATRGLWEFKYFVWNSLRKDMSLLLSLEFDRKSRTRDC